MNNFKMVLRVLCNIVFVIFISLFVKNIYTNDVVEVIRYYTFLLPFFIILIIWGVFGLITYLLYCYKNKGKNISFFNKDKSRLRKIISVSILVVSTILYAVYCYNTPMFIDSDKFMAQMNVVNDFQIKTYSYTDNSKIVLYTSSIECDDQIILGNLVANEGNFYLSTSEEEQDLVEVKFEFAKNLSGLNMLKVLNAKIDDVNFDYAIHIDGKTVKPERSHIQLDSIDIVYEHMSNQKVNRISMCVSNGNSVLYVYECWDKSVVLDVDGRINEWVEIFKQLVT